MQFTNFHVGRLCFPLTRNHRSVQQILLQQPHTRTRFYDFDLKKVLLLESVTSEAVLPADGTRVPMLLLQQSTTEYGVPSQREVAAYCMTPTLETCLSKILVVARSNSDPLGVGVYTGTRTVKLMTSPADLLVVCRYLPCTRCIGGERTTAVANMCTRESK